MTKCNYPACECIGYCEGIDVEGLYETRLRAVLSVVQEYLPPDGISAKEAMSKITRLVDPWPAAGVSVDRHQTFCTDESKQEGNN
jgi:hypothetical protein